MKRLIVIILILVFSSTVFAAWNLNGDCIVNFQDFAIFAQSWQTTYDVNDLAGFAGEWLTYTSTDRAPVPVDQSAEVLQGASRTITLQASDENEDPLAYSIRSLPDPNEGTITGISSVPTVLGGNTFEFNADANYAGDVTITFGVDDGTGLTPPCGGLVTGEVTITVNTQPVKPTAYAQDVNVMQYVTEVITLNASDDGQPDPPARLAYTITSLPSGTLQDPIAGGTEISSVPYTLLGGGSVVWYSHDTNGTDSFNWKANDGGSGETGGDSNTVTCTLNVLENLLDSLTFDGQGYVTIADSNYTDIVDGWGIDFWVKSREPFAGLLKKRGSGVGYEIGLVSGKPKIYLFNASGDVVASARGDYRVDDGQWNEVAFTFNTITGGIRLTVQQSGLVQIWDVNGTFPSFSNSDDLIVGLNAKRPYRGQLDKLRFFSGITDPTAISSIIQGLSDRTESGNEVFFGIGKASSVLFMCDEATGTTISDSKDGQTGNFNSSDHVKWHPQIEIFRDASVKRHHSEMEKRKCD